MLINGRLACKPWGGYSRTCDGRALQPPPRPPEQRRRGLKHRANLLTADCTAFPEAYSLLPVDDVTTEWLHSYRVPLLILRQVGVERRRDETDERSSRLGDVNPTAIALDDADFG
jgi:hypothetical protein